MSVNFLTNKNIAYHAKNVCQHLRSTWALVDHFSIALLSKAQLRNHTDVDCCCERHG
jgi:hypothetical protein